MFSDSEDECTIEEIFDNLQSGSGGLLLANQTGTEFSGTEPSCSSWSMLGGSPSSSSTSSSTLSPAVASQRASPAVLPEPPKKRRRRLGPEGIIRNLDVCAVCGDRANGYHYHSATCNSCRVFFRRTILSKLEHHCRRTGNCFETLQRNQYLLCRSCRYEKCIKVGMKPEAVMRKADPKSTETSSAGDNALQVARTQAPSVLFSRADKVSGLIKNMDYLEGRLQAIRRSEYCPRTNSGIDIEYLLMTPSSLGMNYKPMEGWPLPNDPRLFDCQLSLDGHIENRRTLNMPAEYRYSKTHKEWIYVDSIYAIDTIKTFDFFSRLKHSDKVALIKHVTTITSIFTSCFFSYQNGSMITLYPDGRTPYRIHELNTKVTNYSPKRNMLQMKMDQPTYLLLKGIYICDPTAANLSDHGRQIISEEREMFASSLMSYMTTQYGPSRAPAMFAECMEMYMNMNKDITKMRSLDALLMALNLKKKSKLGTETGGVM